MLVRIDAENGAAERGDALLDLIKRRSFFDARLAPGSPEIQQDNFAAEIGEMRGLAVEGELEILGGTAAKAWLALAIIGMNKKGNECRDKRDDEGGFQFPFQSVVQGPYNSRENCESEATSLTLPRRLECDYCGFCHHSR